MPRDRKEKTEFGVYLVKAISDADMSQADFIAEVGIARPYFYDILKNSPPPKETLEKMLGVLEKRLPPDDTRRSTFMNIAAKCRGEIPADINDLIKEHPNEWDSIRIALTQMLSTHA